MTDERITREVTPLVEVLASPQSVRSRLIQQTDSGAVFEDEGRVVFKMPGPTGRPIRLLLDPDVDLYSLVLGTDSGLLTRYFEVHVNTVPHELPRSLRGTTLVAPWQSGPLSTPPDAEVAVRVPRNHPAAPANAAGIFVELAEDIPEVWPASGPPICAEVPVVRPSSTDILPQLMHGMGTGRYPVRELRMRIDPTVFQKKDRRPPFLSEVVEVVASAAGCSTSQLGRELALRGRLVKLGLRRHLLPDPYFVTWIFRAHRTRGLVPATDHFPIPRRVSKRELMRGTPESEHPRLMAYLGLLEDSKPRLQALAERDLFAVSVHFLPNPDMPLFPNHGGIGRWNGSRLLPLG